MYQGIRGIFIIINLKNKLIMRTFWTFVTGVAAGSIIALLYAPDRGTETRRKIADRTRRVADELRSNVESGMDELSETTERVYGKAGEMVDKTRSNIGRSRS